MAFSFFKKREYADIIFTNCVICTMDPDRPDGEAVACKDGKVLAVGDGDELNHFIGPDTVIVDLHSQFMTPGFIKFDDHLAQKAFSPSFSGFPEWTGDGLESFLTALKKAIAGTRTDGPLFFYGGYRHQLPDMDPEEIRSHIDQIEKDRPVTVLLSDCTVCLMNTAAIDTLHTAAEEDGIRSISLDYIVSILSNYDDHHDIYNSILQFQKKIYTSEGFTTVYDINSFDYPQAMYRSELLVRLMMDIMPFRYHSAYLLSEDQDPSMVIHKLRQRRTECIELQDMICCNGFHASTAKLPEIIFPTALSADIALPGSNAPLPNFDSDALSDLCVDVADNGFHLVMSAGDQASLEIAAQALGAVRNAGYKKNAAVLMYDDALSEKEIYEYIPKEEVILWSDLDPAKATSVEQALERLTVDAAYALGKADQLGTIRKGMAADFAIFAKDPTKMSLHEFANRAAFTVVAGRIIE